MTPTADREVSPTGACVDRCIGSFVFLVAIIAWFAISTWLRYKGWVPDPTDDWGTTDLSVTTVSHAMSEQTHYEPEGFAGIRQSDPVFDAEAFYDHVREMFLEIHKSAAARDLRPVASFIEPALLAQIDAHIRGETGAAQILQPGELEPTRIAAMSIDRRDGYDIVHVLVQAKGPADAADDIVENSDADGPDPVVKFREYWTLVRAIGAKSQADWSLHKCSNCGAPIDTDDRVKCSYCGVRMADPAYDWVVRKIAAD
jgi:hypothetical protein